MRVGVVHAVLVVVGTALLLLLVRVVASSAGLPLLPLAPQLAAWASVAVVRLDVVQRLLGGPALTGRTALRQVLGCALLTAALLVSGLAVLVPLACLLVVAVHAQWDERPSALPGAATSVALTAGSQALVLAGVVDSLVPPRAGVLVTVLALLLALATSANLVLVARQRSRADAALGGERAERDAALLHALDHDQLTGALGRRGLERRLALLGESGGQGGTACVVLDLDGFKPVNDRYGHAAGDAVLVAVVDRFRAALPEGSLLARTGGDEFVVVVPGMASDEAARDVARRLEACLEAPVAVVGHEVAVGVSTGTRWAARPGPVEHLLVEADAAMYAAKRARRARTPPAPVRDAPGASALVRDDPRAGVPRQETALDRR